MSRPGVTFAADVTVFIDFVSRGLDDLRVSGIAIRESDAIEHQLHVAPCPRNGRVLADSRWPTR